MKITYLEKALVVMFRAHRGQVDKGGDPYYLHPLRIAEKMPTIYGKVAALLHDVVEDSDYTVADIREMFGANMAVTIDALTHRAEVSEPRVKYYERVKSDHMALAIKRLDVEDNLMPSRLAKMMDDNNISDKDVARIFKKLKEARVILREAV